ncbi:hypothetical protein [Serinibacter salmoneus]|nr:hypothetical protein [Serinibacter salmoneus]
MSGTVLHQRGVLVERRTADAIAGAFREFGLRPGPSAVTRRRAAEQGYVSPLAWDDIDADDAPRGTRRSAPPSSLTAGLDHADLERLLAGESRRLGPVARVSAIVELVRHGYNDRQMAELLLVTERTITRDRMRHGIAPAKEWASRGNGNRRGADVAEVAA